MKLEHNLENALKAKNILISQYGFHESDFVSATQMDTEVGYIVGEPLSIKGDECTSALEMHKQVVSEVADEDNYIDYMIEKGLI